MSTTEPVDPELIEETKQQIRGLVNEIAELAQADIPESEFYDGFLNRVVTALAAHGGVIWKVDDNGRLSLAFQINLQETRLADSEENQIAHGKLLRKAIQADEPTIISPRSGGGDEEEGSNPTDFLLVLALLKADQETVGVVEVFQRPGAAPNTQRGYLRFLVQMCDLAGDYLKTRSLRRFTDRQAMWNQLESFTRAVHRSLEPRAAAFAIANEGRRLIECDRVSVAILRGTKCKVESVSGQDTFDKRSNTITLLQKLATAVVRQGDPMWYSGDTRDLPPQVEDAVQAYVDESHSKTVAILPLKKPKEIDETKAEREPDEWVGALIVEQIEDAKIREGMRQRIDVVAEHSAAALANAVEHNNLFLMPVWRAIGKATWVVRARTLPKTLSITAAIATVIAALCLIPADYSLEGKGELRPAVRRNVFAPTNGTILSVSVKHNDAVVVGQELARLENTQLQVQIADTVGQLAATDKKLNAAAQQTSTPEYRRDPLKKAQIDGEMASLRESKASLGKQLDLLRGDEKKLVIRSPIAGRILTWDVENELRKRPVQMGDVLMKIAPIDEEWELEVAMPEDRMGDISLAQATLGKDLKVNYILALDPKTTYEGKIDDTEPIANAAGEEGSVVRMRVDIRQSVDQLDQKRPGGTVQARVHCGRRSIGYVWFHDVIGFLHRKVWFPLFS